MMTLCPSNTRVAKWLGCLSLAVASLALAASGGGRAIAKDRGQTVEEQVSELRHDVAEIKKSLEEIRDELKAIRGALEAANVAAGTSAQAKSAVQLILSPQDAKTSDDNVMVKATVINRTDKPLGWDREFGVFMDWHVTTDKGIELKADQIADVKRPPPDAWKSRFAVIEPGKSLTRQIDLTGGFVDFFCGVGYSAPNPNPTPFAYQKRVKFPLPKGTRSVTIQAKYRGLTGFGHPEMGFVMEFGQGARAIGLPAEGATSNKIEVPIRDISP
jgi:hypothetical protein